ncbi:MAG: DUF523 and DUF1722 domain-containing protein [Pseudohongiellaceae bacterium]
MTLPDLNRARIPVGISSCLLGENVRYNGGNELNSYIDQTLGQYFEFHRFCPEMAIGLGVPRKPIRLVREKGTEKGTEKGAAQIRCIGAEEPDRDFTGALENITHEQLSWHSFLCGYILKKGSPSCGMERVKVWVQNRMPENVGTGIYAATLMQNFPNLPVEEEGRLGDTQLRENFIQRVYVMSRWKQLESMGLTIRRLVDFHARHKLIVMSHSQQRNRELGRLVAGVTKQDLPSKSEAYIASLMHTLKKVATPKNHVNVLQHVQGFLKRALDTDDKQELIQCIDAYRQGQVPLIVPITLLNHHFRRNPNEYIANSWYMQPYFSGLGLRNQIQG